MNQVVAASSDNVRVRDPKASPQAGSKKYLATNGPQGIEEALSGAMQSLLVKKKPDTAPPAPLLSEYFAQKDLKKDIKLQQEGSIFEDHFPMSWPVDDEHVPDKLARSKSSGVLENRSASRQSHRPCSRQDERPCSRQSNRPSSRQSLNYEERPCSRRSSLDQDSRPPSRQSRRPSLSRGMSRAVLAPLEKAPPLPEVPDKLPLDVRIQPPTKPTTPASSTGREPAAPSKPVPKPFPEGFPKYYKEHIAPSCGTAFWSSLHAKFAKVQKEPTSATSPTVPVLNMPSRPTTAGTSRPGSAAGGRTPKPQILLSGGKLKVLAETSLETGRFRRPDSAGSIKEECCSEVLVLTEHNEEHLQQYSKDVHMFSPSLKCLTVN
jgi:hypothetical protein